MLNFKIKVNSIYLLILSYAIQAVNRQPEFCIAAFVIPNLPELFYPQNKYKVD